MNFTEVKQKRSDYAQLLKTHSYKALLSKYHLDNVSKAKQGIAFIGGYVLTDDDGLNIEVNPSAYDLAAIENGFRNLGRHTRDLGGGYAVKGILFTTSAPMDIANYGNPSDNTMAVTTEGPCTVVSIWMPLVGYTDDPMGFLKDNVVTALRTELVDGIEQNTGSGPNAEKFQVLTPRGALDDEPFPFEPFTHFMNETLIGMCGATDGLTAKLVPIIDEAADEGRIEQPEFWVTADLLAQHMFDPSWDELWDQQWGRAYAQSLERFRAIQTVFAEI